MAGVLSAWPYTRPFLKWAGNKYRVLKHILPVLPAGERFIEPFAGAGAVFLNTRYPQSLLADVNPDLIGLYKSLQHGGNDFIEYCRPLFTPQNNKERAYYALREEFNAVEAGERRSALFLYLNRHGYNGLCRYNASGGYNVPFGRYVKPYFPEKEMRLFHIKAAHSAFMVADFRVVMEGAGPGDVVYCDPPYVPLSKTANFTSYAASAFGLPEQEMLASLARKAARNGATVILSNHDTPFIRDLYVGAMLITFEVQRNISRDGNKRKKAKELVAVFT